MASAAHNTSEWQKRSVVSSFITKVNDGTTRVALFQRSDKVSTYRHHLAPISGTIDATDPTPLSAAWREIAEETTLTPSTLALLRQGKPYTFRDPSVRREWTIYPFLFRLREPAHDTERQIRIDWEHEGWGWHDPDDIVRGVTGKVEGVPRLAESLRRVWFETDLGAPAAGILAAGLDDLAHDHESGARQLAGVALQTLRGVVAELEAPREGPAAEGWWAKVRFAAWHLWKNGRESMGAAIMSTLLAALAGAEEAMAGKPASSWRDAVLDVLDAKAAARRESAALVSKAFVAYLGNTFPSKVALQEPISILTLSESSAIRQGLHHAAASGFVLDLRVLESRPLFEGVSLAASLVQKLGSSSPSAASKHEITLYSDAAAALASSGLDLVVIGADRIAASGAISNKTGSLPAVLCAKQISPSARVVVLGESDKIAPPGRPEDHVVEDNDPSQISRAWLAENNTVRIRDAAKALQHAGATGSVQIQTRNVFFEWVPAQLIDAYVTESGEWTGQEIARHSDRIKAEETRIFGTL
ncbi:Methylthioribose-1-phosphate isomerase [Staphylotrichum tortipilum]|uniref:Methylthioribose-1-phosphate isomerase n=1 Tax=Staphylotrichum tortipilum TaxID=2831512 RepID=A0AAN6MJ39_9PEZI|nr:Methylthioribose-1-phosphate isomerase [Staphylotrichum longicolle]